MAKRTMQSVSQNHDLNSFGDREAINFGWRLKEFRQRKGLSQEQMAERLRIKQQTLSEMENGAELTTTHLAQLRNAGLDIDSFLADETDWDIDVMSRLLERIGNIHGGGIEEIHPDRHEALKSFHRYIEREVESIDITGSSLKGLLTMHTETFETMKKQIRSGAGARILLTHPAFAVLRAFVEGRNYEMITNEIEEAFSKYCKEFSELGKDRVQVKVALHPPTICGIFLKGQGKAMINPYSLTVEAFSTQTIICRDTGSQKCMFRQYHLHHFVKPFLNDLNNQVTITLDEYLASKDEPDNALRIACLEIDKALEPFKEKGGKGRKSAADYVSR